MDFVEGQGQSSRNICSDHVKQMVPCARGIPRIDLFEDTRAQRAEAVEKIESGEHNGRMS